MGYLGEKFGEENMGTTNGKLEQLFSRFYEMTEPSDQQKVEVDSKFIFVVPIRMPLMLYTTGIWVGWAL